MNQVQLQPPYPQTPHRWPSVLCPLQYFCRPSFLSYDLGISRVLFLFVSQSAEMTAFTDNAPDVFAAVCILAVFACAVFPLRLYIRLSREGAWGYDDWCMSVGFVRPVLMNSRIETVG